MIARLLFSLSNRLSDASINAALQPLTTALSTPQLLRPVIVRTLQTAEHGSYPSADYYRQYYPDPGIYYGSVAEILLAIDKMQDYFKKEWITNEYIERSKHCDSYQELLDMSAQLMKEGLDNLVVTEFEPPVLLSEQFQRAPTGEGIVVELPSIDKVTNGFRPGQVATIAAFSGGGKTTAWLHTTYNAVVKGKKVVYVSLEMTPEILWGMLQAKHAIVTGALPNLATSDVTQGRLSDEQKKKIVETEPEFREKIANNLLIVDESTFNKAVLGSSEAVMKMFSNCEKHLGGLDLIIFDHVHQIELMAPKNGDNMLRNIASATKQWRNTAGNHLVCGWACQANREGYKNAMARNGRYDLTAIGDLNEVIRSSAYIIFLFRDAEDDSSQEVQIMMGKHRYGPTVSEPFNATFLPSQLLISETYSSNQTFSDLLTNTDIGGTSFNNWSMDLFSTTPVTGNKAVTDDAIGGA